MADFGQPEYGFANAHFVNSCRKLPVLGSELPNLFP